jgi:hypothetical protein
MTAWWQMIVAWFSAAPPSVMLALLLLAVVFLVFTLLCIAMRRGHRVSLGGEKGFVFEALPSNEAVIKKGKK